MLAEKFAAVQDALQEALEDGRLSFPEAWKITARIIQAAAFAVDSLEDPKQLNALIGECEQAFDLLIAPYDIVGVPDWIETRFVDPTLRAQIRPFLTSLAEPLLDG